jgi:hypothetical protein
MNHEQYIGMRRLRLLSNEKPTAIMGKLGHVPLEHFEKENKYTIKPLTMAQIQTANRLFMARLHIFLSLLVSDGHGERNTTLTSGGPKQAIKEMNTNDASWQHS